MSVWALIAMERMSVVLLVCSRATPLHQDSRVEEWRAGSEDAAQGGAPGIGVEQKTELPKAQEADLCTPISLNYTTMSTLQPCEYGLSVELLGLAADFAFSSQRRHRRHCSGAFRDVLGSPEQV